jgi:hypothetical protein
MKGALFLAILLTTVGCGHRGGVVVTSGPAYEYAPAYHSQPYVPAYAQAPGGYYHPGYYAPGYPGGYVTPSYGRYQGGVVVGRPCYPNGPAPTGGWVHR